MNQSLFDDILKYRTLIDKINPSFKFELDYIFDLKLLVFCTQKGKEIFNIQEYTNSVYFDILLYELESAHSEIETCLYDNGIVCLVFLIKERINEHKKTLNRYSRTTKIEIIKDNIKLNQLIEQSTELFKQKYSRDEYQTGYFKYKEYYTNLVEEIENFDTSTYNEINKLFKNMKIFSLIGTIFIFAISPFYNEIYNNLFGSTTVKITEVNNTKKNIIKYTIIDKQKDNNKSIDKKNMKIKNNSQYCLQLATKSNNQEFNLKDVKMILSDSYYKILESYYGDNFITNACKSTISKKTNKEQKTYHIIIKCKTKQKAERIKEIMKSKGKIVEIYPCNQY